MDNLPVYLPYVYVVLCYREDENGYTQQDVFYGVHSNYESALEQAVRINKDHNHLYNIKYAIVQQERLRS